MTPTEKLWLGIGFALGLNLAALAVTVSHTWDDAAARTGATGPTSGLYGLQGLGLGLGADRGPWKALARQER